MKIEGVTFAQKSWQNDQLLPTSDQSINQFDRHWDHLHVRHPARQGGVGDDIWVVHEFQKKSQGIKTPKHEIDLVKDRLKRLKEMFAMKKENSRWCAEAATCSET